MTVYKKLLVPFLAVICTSVTAHSSSLFLENTLSISGAIGYNHFNKPSDQTLIISNYVPDLLTNSRQHHTPTYTVSAKQQLNIPSNTIGKIMLGPALYYQQAHNSGEVWEMLSSEFYNYNYDLKSKNINLLVESDIYLKPVIAHITPFLTAGVGISRAQMRYEDHALPGIDLDSERHWSRTQTKAVYEIGAGIALPLNPHWTVDLRYAWLYRGHASSSITQFQSINMNLNNQNALLGIRYYL